MTQSSMLYSTAQTWKRPSRIAHRTARSQNAAAGTKTREMPFSADIQLKPGNNTVLILARQDDDFLNQRTLSIYRAPPPVGIAAKDGKQPANEPSYVPFVQRLK